MKKFLLALQAGAILRPAVRGILLPAVRAILLPAIFTLMSAIPYTLSAQTATTFRITGQLKNITVGNVYLVYAKNGRQTLDSAKVGNGTYVFSGEIAEGQLAVLLDIRPGSARPTPGNVAEIYLEPGSLTVMHVDSFSHTSFTGSRANVEFKKLQEAAKPYKEKEQPLMSAYKAARQTNDEAGAKAIQQQGKAIEQQINDNIYGPFLKTNPQSPIALYVLQLYAAGEPDAPELQPLFDALSITAKNSASGISFQQKLANAEKTGIGKEAMDFTQNDTVGKPITLSSFRGRYVLLDFWASWCVPCRAENPNVVSAYAKYHAKGFDILSVSLDRPDDKDKWLKAIHDDRLAWTQVSDLQFWNNAVAKEYGINSIPQNFLIDPQGKIIGKNLRGDDLASRLQQIFKD